MSALRNEEVLPDPTLEFRNLRKDIFDRKMLRVNRLTL